MKLRIGTMSIRCPNCGGEEFVGSGKEQMDPADTATCSACGHQFTAAEALELGKKVWQDELARTFGDRFKKAE